MRANRDTKEEAYVQPRRGVVHHEAQLAGRAAEHDVGVGALHEVGARSRVPRLEVVHRLPFHNVTEQDG